MSALADAVAFFLEHAGWSYDPRTETPEEGRQRSAEHMADAEAWAKREGLTYTWRDFWETDHVKEYPDAYDAEPETCESVTLYNENDEVLASLCCIDDATDEYRRVVEAELAYEAMPAEIQEPLPIL